MTVTSKKKGKQKMQRLYQAIADISLDLIAVVDANYVYHVVNQRHLDIFRKPKKFFIGSTIGEVVGQNEFDEKIKPLIDRCLQGEEVKGEYWIESPDQRARYVSARYLPIEYKDGSVTKMVINARDLTDRNQAEKALAKNQKDYRTLFETSQDGIVFRDMEGYIELANKTFLDMIGYSLEEAQKLTIQQITPKKWHAVNKIIDKDKILKEGYSGVYEKEYIRKDGTVFPIEVKAWLIKDSEGQQDRMICIVRDITESKQAKEKLRRSEERFRALYDNNPIMLFTIDEYGRILSVNQYGIDQLGYSKDKLVGKPVINLFYKEDRFLAQENLKQCFVERDTVYSWELRKVRLDKSILWVRETARVVDDIDGMPTALIVCEDITKNRQLSEQLTHQASHDVLTELVNRREFERRLERVLDTIILEESEHALCYMDLDQFKVVNDTCGHVAGDEMLRQISTVLKKEVRKRDTLARLGGDEFGVLMEHCSLAQAERAAGAFQQAVQNYQFIWEGRTFRVGVSIGLVAISRETPKATEILKLADAACYMAKDQGRNRVHVYHPEDEDMAKRHGEMQWVTRIHQALKEDRFCLYAQPIVSLAKKKGTRAQHYELLLRMVDEEGNHILPGAFLPAAERYNLITQVDRWVIENAFALLAANQAFLKQVEFI
ncbi:MAG: diguanylate cyclase (GGDEF)-like protein/PAS domain S-box-containing protein, partial [Planctomycetota bacterium]